MDKKNLIRYIFFAAVLIFALPFNFGKLTGISNWFSPFLLLNSVFVLKSVVILNLIGFIILIVTWFKKRWFCKFLCPVGFSQDIVTKLSGGKTGLSISKVPHINKWLVAISFGGALLGFPVFLFFDPMAIFNGFFVLFIHPLDYLVLFTSALFPLLLLLQIIIPGLWCEKLCPLGGLQLFISELKTIVHGSSSDTKKIDVGRRLFIGGALGAFAAIALPGFAEKERELAIHPPGSVDANSFNTLCIRCGSCIKVCPTQILNHETRFGFGLLTPVIKFNDGYCLENCNLCSVVCPSGAITSFSTEAKKILKIGKAVVKLENCLLMKMKECAVCKNACHYNSIDFVNFDDKSLKMRPAINGNNCNGCGACAVICPENCITVHAI